MGSALTTLSQCRRSAAAAPVHLNIVVNRWGFIQGKVIHADASWTWNKLVSKLPELVLRTGTYAIIDGQTAVGLHSALFDPLSKSIVPNESSTYRVELIHMTCFDTSITSSLDIKLNEYKIHVFPNMTHAQIRSHLNTALAGHQLPHRLKRLQFVCQSDPTRNFYIGNDDTPIDLNIYTLGTGTGTWKVCGDALALVQDPNVDNSVALLEIDVKTNDLSSRAFSVVLRSDTTMFDIKKICAHRFGVDVNMLQMVNNGQPIQDHETLAGCQVPNKGVLRCAILRNISHVHDD